MSRVSDFLGKGICSPPVSSTDTSLRKSIADTPQDASLSSPSNITTPSTTYPSSSITGAAALQPPKLPLTPELWIYEIRVSCQSIVHEWMRITHRIITIYKTANVEPDAIIADLQLLWGKWKQFASLSSVNFEDCKRSPIFADLTSTVLRCTKPKGYMGGSSEGEDARRELGRLQVELLKIRLDVMEAEVRIDEADGESDAAVDPTNFLPLSFLAVGGVDVSGEAPQLPEDLVKKLEECSFRKGSARSFTSTLPSLSEDDNEHQEKDARLSEEVSVTKHDQDEDSGDDLINQKSGGNTTGVKKMKKLLSRSQTHPPSPKDKRKLPKWYEKNTSKEEKARDKEIWEKALEFFGSR